MKTIRIYQLCVLVVGMSTPQESWAQDTTLVKEAVRPIDQLAGDGPVRPTWESLQQYQMFINREAIHGSRPWTTTHEKGVWFTRSPNEPIVYAMVTEDPVTGQTWAYGARKTITLTSVQATENTQVFVLGQNDKVLEYRPSVDPGTAWTQDEFGLHISAMRAQRIYNDRRWPNPIVLKITHANDVK